MSQDLSKTPTGISYQAFLDWCDEDTRAEWVDGEVLVVSPASNRHQDLSDFLAFLMRAHAEAHSLGLVRSAPFQMHLPEQRRGREPDLLFISGKREDQLRETHLDGPADLVVEIVSPDSRLRDRGEKFAEYEAAGVREYWVLDPPERRADFFTLGDDGRYERRHADETGIYRSTVLEGFELKVPWLWQDPLPSVLKVLGELGLR